MNLQLKNLLNWLEKQADIQIYENADRALPIVRVNVMFLKLLRKLGQQACVLY